MNAEQRRLQVWFEHEQSQPRQSIIQALDSLGLKDGDRVADIGCGPGVHLRHILERVAPTGEVVGIDTSAERLDVARSMLGAELESGAIRLVEGDLHALDRDLGSFDVVWMSLVLHHEEIPVEVIRELREIAAPGGRIAILDGDDLASFPFLPWPPEFELTVRHAVARAAADEDEARPEFGRRYTARSLPAILGDAGLTDMQLRAYVDIRQAPLDEWERRDVRAWFVEGFGGRIRDYLTPADWRRYEAYFTPGDPGCILDDPGFFFARTWFLGVGKVV